MVDENEYKRYLEDQINDCITDSQYLEQRKKETYKYCNFLFQKIPTLDPKVGVILDIGCREFFTYDFFNEKFGIEIKGIDVGAAGLNYTAKNKKPAVYLDAHELSSMFRDNALDVIMSFHALEHMYDITKVLKQCYACLKPDGVFYFAVPMPSKNEKRGHWAEIPTKQFMVDLCKDIGFKLIYANVFPANCFKTEIEMLGMFRK
jgi:SAM-dependent methyltransferase